MERSPWLQWLKLCRRTAREFLAFERSQPIIQGLILLDHLLNVKLFWKFTFHARSPLRPVLTFPNKGFHPSRQTIDIASFTQPDIAAMPNHFLHTSDSCRHDRQPRRGRLKDDSRKSFPVRREQ